MLDDEFSDDFGITEEEKTIEDTIQNAKKQIEEKKYNVYHLQNIENRAKRGQALMFTIITLFETCV